MKDYKELLEKEDKEYNKLLEDYITLMNKWYKYLKKNKYPKPELASFEKASDTMESFFYNIK